jgi:glyoxylase-like metal-dependent hydrolase (beta-lactamase superfamily II)
LKTVEHLPKSPFFQLVPLSEGVYAAIVEDGTGALGNAGIVDLGDRTLVFDTFQTPVAAIDLKIAAESLTGKSVSLVINSHWHMDHVLGNQVFEGAWIVSTEKTKKLINERVASFIETVKKHPDYPDHLAKAAEKENDLGKRRELIRNSQDARHIAEHIHKFRLTPPNVTFREQLWISGSKRSILIQTMGSGHTEDDTILYLPEDKILFAADLVSVDFHPSMKYGDPDKWLAILDKLSEMQIDQVVPGHGTVGEKQAVERVKQYIRDVKKAAAEIGYSLQDVGECTMNESFRHWASPSLYWANIGFLCQR